MTGAEDDDPGQAPYWLKLFQEASSPFDTELAHGASPEIVRQLYMAALAQYRHTCAATGAVFAQSAQLLRDDITVTPIRPLAAGGALHVNNLLCLCSSAGHAFRQGHMTIGNKLELLVDLSRIDPELLEKLNPNGRLWVPAGATGPDPEAIRFHREHVFFTQA